MYRYINRETSFCFLIHVLSVIWPFFIWFHHVSSDKLTLILKIISQCGIKHIMTLLLKTIMSVLKVSTYIITSIPCIIRPIGHAAIYDVLLYLHNCRYSITYCRMKWMYLEKKEEWWKKVSVFVWRLLHQGVRIMVFNATFNNISVISWLSVLPVGDPK